MEMNTDFELEESASERGMKWLGRVLAVIIILVVSALGDVMYITLMTNKFPAGLLLIICYAGALTGFLCVVYMLIGKSVLFTPGPQMVVAWLVFSLELLMTALNLILVFQGDGTGGFLEVWGQLAPATPVINMAGVAVLFFLDESQKMKHEDVEMEWDMKRANRRHIKAMARARLKLQTKQLSFLVTELDRAVCSPESLSAIQQTAIDLNTALLGQLSGGRAYRAPLALPAPAQNASALPSGQTVESDNQPAPAPVVDSVPCERCNNRVARSGGRYHQFDNGNRAFICNSCVPVGQSAEKKSLARTAKKFLGNLGKRDRQEPVSLAQTAPISDMAAEAAARSARDWDAVNGGQARQRAKEGRVFRSFQTDIARNQARASARPVSSSAALRRRSRRTARFQQFVSPSPVTHASAPIVPVDAMPVSVEDDEPKNAVAAPVAAKKATQKRAASTQTKKSVGSSKRTTRRA